MGKQLAEVCVFIIIIFQPYGSRGLSQHLLKHIYNIASEKGVDYCSTKSFCTSCFWDLAKPVVWQGHWFSSSAVK